MKKLEQEIKTFLVEREWDHLKPADIAKSISIEAAELLELFQWTDEGLEEVKKDKEKLDEIKKELADVFIYCLQMSVHLGLDTEKTILDKLDIAKKKFPAEVVKKWHAERPGTDENYWKIKKAHRNNE